MIPILHNETTSVKKEKKKKRVRRYINKRELRLPVHSIESLSRESLGGRMAKEITCKHVLDIRIYSV